MAHHEQVTYSNPRNAVQSEEGEIGQHRPQSACSRRSSLAGPTVSFESTVLSPHG